MENIVYFNKNLKEVDEKVRQRLGIRGRRAVDLAMMGLPIVPGFIIDSVLTQKLPQINLKEILSTYIGQLEKDTKKKYGDAEKPLMLKVVLSSDLNVPHFPSIHNIGMNATTVEAFGKYTGREFAYGEYLFLLRNLANKIFEIDEKERKQIEGKIAKKAGIDDMTKAIESYQKLFGDKFSEDVNDQLSLIIKGASSRYCDSAIDVDNSLSIMVQVMVYGNWGDNSYAGNYYTRNIITGDPEIQGNFGQSEFDIQEGKAKDISKIEKKHYTHFTEIAHKIEDNFKEIREIKFTIEEGDFWLVEQKEVDDKSTQSQIKALLDLTKRKIVSETYTIERIKPNQLNELLHPVIDPRSTKNVKFIKGGISGSTGAAIGRVFFSTPKLLEE
ncbi:MAG TPA: hypothetical protein PKN50_10895, partial [Spirochaetota bacterium]|nr:hypothetical protein [Spirochaetota bacterium]